MRNDLDHVIDREEWEPTVAGRRLRFLEMSSGELKRYAARMEDQYERAVAIMAEKPPSLPIRRTMAPLSDDNPLCGDADKGTCRIFRRINRFR